MTSLGTKALVLLFVALVLQCAFDGPAKASAGSPPQEDGIFCGSLNAATATTTLPLHSVPQGSSSEAVHPLTGVYPVWFLAQAIDHPPERPN
jgi:hypothetical protein